jgi:hypothetical protein
MISGGILNQLLDFSPMTVIYRKITNKEDMEMLHKDMDILWAVEMK